MKKRYSNMSLMALLVALAALLTAWFDLILIVYGKK